MEHDSLGTIPTLSPAVGLSETPGEIAGPPPLLGEHTTEILTELGYSPAEVQRLVDRGIALVAEPAAPPVRASA
jgi:crotonobetainyl-CoA:carnitine CoA-transferase CaiB-like acyl-CoA transferase